jgi:phytoene/squalene synthetase
MSASHDPLARSITRSANGQADWTIRLLVDRPLVDDAYRAYAYFRWVDDRLDLGEMDRSEAQVFLTRQETLLAAAYRGERRGDASPEEQFILDLIHKHPDPDSGLGLYIRHLMNVMRFDAERRGRVISAGELTRYTGWLACGVTEVLHFFIRSDAVPPRSPTRYLAAAGAHIAHMLRDTRQDIARGYFNIPSEVLRRAGVAPDDIDHPAYRDWARSRAARARRCLRLGRAYVARVESLRCRIAMLAYCIRFERTLASIEGGGYAPLPTEPSTPAVEFATTVAAAVVAALPPPSLASRHPLAATARLRSP